MKISEMDLFGERFVVIECELKNVEIYQVKTFYYQRMTGIRPFRFSMSQDNCFFYFENSTDKTLAEVLQTGVTLNELHSMLNQMSLIFRESRDYLLYSDNFILDPRWIKVNTVSDSLRINLLYLPLKQGKAERFKSSLELLISILLKAFNELNDMEGFYYFIRLQDELQNSIEYFDIWYHLDTFLNGKEGIKSRKHDKPRNIQ